MGEREDEETITAHQKRRQHQIQLSIEKQYKLVVKRLLDLTYSKRRKLLVRDYTKISTFLELCSILCPKQQVNEKPFFYICIVQIPLFADWKKLWLILYSITYWVFIKDISEGDIRIF